MYKCPKCGESESFSTMANLAILNVWIEVNGDGEINDIEEDVLGDDRIEKQYDVTGLVKCGSCGYEASEDEFAEVITSNM